ncbi:copper amine oxidase [Cohnella faecalis]|uniref:Copper amine oxidase n=1 Tax=Cohnella faecalis TaxID=2315694 RepID=A0A398CYM6_9BACL|nr:copper amine oxidase [Cohnella faecalis]RIE04331.1 copper amine oxidase [Cohnella faecalis]
MNVRKIALAVLVLTVIGGTAAFADNVSQKLRVIVNKQELVDGGVLVDGKAYLAVRALADSVQAILSWDDAEKKVVITKPNVHMFTMQDSTTFGSVSKGRNKFNIFSQIDNLKVDITAFKVTITDPYDDTTWLDGRDTSDKDFPDSGKDNFWFKTKEVSYDFKYSGKYVIRFWMKPKGETAFQVVSEKIISAK